MSLLSFLSTRKPSLQNSGLIINLFFSLFPCLVTFPLYLVPGPICHFPISCLQTAGSSSIITFLELSLNVRGNSISLSHGEEVVAEEEVEEQGG